jgi:hypothetical protein
MANPGPYPMGPAMGGPMQPMGGPPMGGPPMGGMMHRRPARQGTSRVVPVVVSAGLAIGVFCGLLFGLGTGEQAVIVQPKVSNNAKAGDDFTPETLGRPDVKGPPKAGSAAVAAGSNAGPNAGSGAGSDAAGANAGSAEPAIKPVKLIVEVTPENVAKTAKVFVDDKPLEGTTMDIPLDPGNDKKKVKIVVKAPGYKDVVQETEAEGESVTVKVELIKGRSSLASDTTGTPATGTPSTGTPATGTPATGTPTPPRNPPPRNPGKKPGKGSGGLIDI